MAAYDIINWTEATVVGCTLVPDRLGVTNRAYNFDWINDYINLWAISLWQVFSISLNTKLFTLTWARYFLDSQTGRFILAQSRAALWNTLQVFDWVSWQSFWFTFTDNINYNIIIIKNWTSISAYINWSQVWTTLTIANTTIWTLTALWSDFAWSSSYLHWNIDSVIFFNKALSASEVSQLYNESKTNYLYPFRKTFPAFLNDWKVLHLTGDVNWTTAIDISWNWNATCSSTPTIKRIWQHKIISLSNQSLTWASRTIWTKLCWELVSWKWILQINPAYITATWIASTTKDLANIYISNKVLTTNEIQSYQYSTYIQ